MSSRGQVIIVLIVILVVIALAITLGEQITRTSEDAVRLMALLAGVGICLITFVRPDAGFIILIFSMLLSPELGVGRVPQRAVVIRIDDILLMLVFVTWVARLALRHELSLVRRTPLNAPLVLFLVTCGLSTVLGIVGQSVDNPAASLFYLLKYAEYIMLFIMFASQVRSRRQLRWYTVALLATAIIVGGLGYAQIASGRSRITAPFEGIEGEPNTLAGYFLIIMGVAAALFVAHSGRWVRMAGLGILLFLIPPFLMTLSRGGYAGFIVMYLVLMWLVAPRQRVVMGVLLAVTICCAPVLFPQTVKRRVMGTAQVSMRTQEYGGRVWIDKSARARIDVWPYMLRKVAQRPVFGYGVTGVGLVDQQYALVLGEVGVVGLLIFLWTRWLLWRHGMRIWQHVQSDPLARSIALGFLISFAGLLAHSFAGNIFIIVRIMEPFWALAALVMALPQILADEPQDQAPARGYRFSSSARLAAGRLRG